MGRVFRALMGAPLLIVSPLELLNAESHSIFSRH